MLPDFFPDWALNYSGRGGLVSAMEMGREFADWVDKKVARQQAGGQLQLQKRGDSPIYDMIGKYRAELPLKGAGMGEDWSGKADILINTTDGPIVGDFKMHRNWSPSAYEADKYAPQLAAYQSVFQERYGTRPDVATIHVSQGTWQFLQGALEAGVKPADILDELTNSTNVGTWTNEQVQAYSNSINATSQREVLYQKAKPPEDSRMQALIEANKRYDEAIEAATGMTRGHLRSIMSSEPQEQDKERLYAFMEDVHFRAQLYAVGAYTNVGVVKEFVNKIAPILPGHTEGSTVANTITAYTSVKTAPQVQRGVAAYEPLRQASQWKQLDPNLGDSVLYREDTGEVAIVHQREGAAGKDVYWRGTVERLGGQLAINGRLLVPQQLRRHDVQEGQQLPGYQWQETERVLPDVFGEAVGLVKALGGGVNAAKAISKHMNQVLQPMPSVGGDVFTTSAARMSYQQSMVGLSPEFSVRQQYAVMERHRAMRSGTRQAFDLRELASAAGFAYDPQSGQFYGGETSAGKVFKRTRAGIRGELVMPTRVTGEGTRVWDADRMMLSPLVQRDPTGQARASRYGPEVGIRARAAMFAHGGLMPEGMGYGSAEFLGMGDDRMFSQVVKDTIELEGHTQFQGLDQAYYDEESGGFVIGFMGGDPNKKVVWSKQKWDRFDLDQMPSVRHEGGKTFIDLQGTVSTRGGSGEVKAWMGNKAMLAAMTNIDELFGNDIMRGLDVILPKAKNVRQFTYGLVSAKYQDRPEDLAKAIYGEDRYKQFMVYEQMREGAEGIQLASEARARLQEIRGRMGKEASYAGVLMPLEEADQERLFELGRGIAKERLQENARYRMRLTDMDYEMLKGSGIVMKNLGTRRGPQGDQVRFVEAQVPALFGDIMMQIGREFQGEAQVSLEELLGLAGGRAGYGDEYQQAVMKQLLPNIMRASGHYRKMYADILTARMHTRSEAGVKVSDDRIIDLEDLRAQMGAPGRNTSEFLEKLTSLEGAKGKFIRIGNMLVPTPETLAALQVPDDPAKTMHWLNEEERRKMAIDTKDVSSITNAVMRLVEKGLDVDTLAKLEQSLYGSGMHGEKLGLAMTPSVAKGALAARMARGGIEGAAVSYSGVDDNVIVLGKDKLRQMFGTDDFNVVNQAIKQGAYAALQRRPNVLPELSSMIGVRIESSESEYAKLRGIPGDFAGMAFGKMVAGMMFGDYDGDRVMALLTSTIASAEGEAKDKTAGVIKYAASQRGMYERWGAGMAQIMGFDDARKLLGKSPTEDFTAADMLQLNIMLGKEYSEVYKMMGDLTEDQQKFLGAMMGPAQQRGDSIVEMFLDRNKFMAHVSAEELRSALEGEAVSKEETSRAYNRIIRELHGYVAQTGEGDRTAATVFGFKAYQKTLDLSGFSDSLRSYMNIWEGYNAWGKGKSLQERLGPVGAEGQILSRAVPLHAMRDDFTVELMKGLLGAEEIWSTKFYQENATAMRKAQAEAISSDEEVRKEIEGVLERGGGAQEIWEQVFGKDVTATTATAQGRERFAKAWSTPGWLMGAPGAAAFSRMRRSMYKGDMATVAMRTGEWERLNRMTGGQLTKLSDVGRSMAAQTHVLSGRGGAEFPQMLEMFPGMQGKEVMDEMLSWMDENIPRRQPPGEVANLLRYITGGEDDLLQTLEGLGLNAQELSQTMPRLREIIGSLQRPEFGFQEGAWQETGIVPRVLSEWAQKATGEGGLGAVLRELGGVQAGKDVPKTFQHVMSAGYEDPAMSIAAALGFTTQGIQYAGGAPAGGTGGGQVAGGGQMNVAQALQGMLGVAATTGNEQMLWGIRKMAGDLLFGGKERAPLAEQMRKFEVGPGFAETYASAYQMLGSGEAAMAFTQKQMGEEGAGSIPAMMRILEKTGQVDAAAMVMPELTQEHVDRLRDLNTAFADWSSTVEPAIEAGKDLTSEQRKFTQMVSKGLQELPGMRIMAEMGEGDLGAEARGLVEGMAGAQRRVGAGQRLMQQQDWEIMAREAEGAGGIGGGVGRFFRQMTSGWEMMRLQRMWQMTGAPVFQQMMPAAAQAQLAGWQTAGAIGGYEPGVMPGGVAGGLMARGAAERQAMIDAGRTGYAAWGAMPGMAAARQAQAMFGPAAGIGLVGGGLLGTAAGAMGGMGAAAAAGSIGLPLAALIGVPAALMGMARYGWQASEPGAESTVANLRATRGYDTGIMANLQMGLRTLGAGFRGEMEGGTVRDWIARQATAGQQLAETPLGDLGVGERGTMMNFLATGLRREGGWEAFDEQQIMQMIGQAAPFMPELEGMSVDELITNQPELLQIMRETGRGPQEYAGMAGALGMGPFGAGRLLEMWGRRAGPEQLQAQYQAERWAPARGFGIEGERIAEEVVSPFETEARRAGMARVAGDFSEALADATGGLIDFGDSLQQAVEVTGLRAGELTTLQATQLQQAGGVAERARMMGLAVPEQPEQLTGAWVEQQFRETMPVLQARMGMQQQLMGMGLGMEGAGAAAEVFQTPGQMQTFQRFLGGDPRVMSLLGQRNVQGVFQPNVDIGYGMQVGAGQMRGQFLGGIQAGLEGAGYSQPQVQSSMTALTQAMNDLRPVIETDTGLRMGTTRMWQGWSADITGGAGPGRVERRRGYLAEQGMRLPEIGFGPGDVDENRFQRFADIMEDFGTRGIEAQQQTLQNQYQEFQMGQRTRGLEWQRVSQLGGTFEEPGLGGITTRGSLDITRELRSLGRLWEDFTSTYQERSREVERAQFMENWEVRAARMPQQFAWQREDLAFQGAQQSMQFGWQMEDLTEAERFATGRDRRRIQRQRERAAIQFSMGMGRLDTMGGRVDTQEQWAKEDLERQKRHFLERNALQDDYQSRYRMHIESRRQLEDELHAIQEFGAQFQLKQAEEALAKQREMNEQMKAIQAVMSAYTQSMQNANAQMGQVVQMIQFLFANIAVGGGGEYNLPDAASGFFSYVQAGFASAASGVQLPYEY